MSERDPFDQSLWDLRDLIDQPVEPRAAFADKLRSRLMSEMSASEFSREEYHVPMDALLIPRPPTSISTERSRRIRPALVLQLAAAALLVVLGVAAALNQGWFRNEPDPSTMAPAAILQTDQTPTAELALEPTSTALPTVVAAGAVQPTVAPPANVAGATWVLPGATGQTVAFGGIAADDDVVYRLLTTPDFSGVQAVDAKTGAVIWQQAHQWTGSLFAEQDGLLFFDGGGQNLVAVNAKTGAETWRAQVDGNPIALEENDDRIFVLLDSDAMVALDWKSGDRLWMSPITGKGGAVGAARVPAIGKIDEEEGVVSAISEHGVISGFDAETGVALWSHEGYDAATVALDTKNDQFVLISGQGIADPTQVIGSIEISDACWDRLNTATESAASPTSGVIWFHIIDPKTGDIVSAVQTTSADTWAACQRTIELGAMPADSATPVQSVQDEDGIIVRIGTIPGIDRPVVAVTLEDGAAFLQLEDGSLARVDVPRRSNQS